MTQQMHVTCGSLPCSSAAFAELSAEILRAGRAVRFRARGASMAPLVRDGDVVLVRPVDPRAVRVGDVVLCADEPGRLLLHRVIRRRAGRGGVRLVVQGDQVAQPDGEIAEAQLYGRVAAIEREGVWMATDGAVLRLLGRAAALRSRWNPGRGRPFRLARRLARKLPVLSKYLS
jgi:signal peptidase I